MIRCREYLHRIIRLKEKGCDSLLRYLIKRILWLIPVILGVAIVIFSIMYFVPGDPATIILGTEATEAELEAKREQLGLNEPYIIQLANYLNRLFLHFDFGRSYKTDQPIMSELMVRLPRTVIIGFSSMMITFIIGIPLGITAAVHQNGWGDRFCMLIALAGVSIPEFWLALMMVVLFALKLRWLPPSGIDNWTCYIMPILAGAMGGMAGLARQSRSSMLEVIRSDYITTARAKGVAEHDVIYKHALPNALLPIITVAGMHLAHIFGGSVVIENVFSIPGIGSYMILAINNRDYPVVEACVLFLAIIFCFVVVLIDIAYGLVDPRIKAQYVGKKRG